MPTFKLAAAIESSIHQFVQSRCVTGEWLITPSADIFAAYSRWCELNKVPAQSPQMLGRYLRKMGLECPAIYRTGKTCRCWTGIGLKDE